MKFLEKLAGGRVRPIGEELERARGMTAALDASLAAIADRIPVDNEPLDMARQVRVMIKARRLRDDMLPEGQFGDPTWNMVLDLFLAELEGRTMSISDMCVAAGVPVTTALRWLGRMTASGAILREPDKDDPRRANVRLSDAFGAKVRDYMQQTHTLGITGAG